MNFEIVPAAELSLGDQAVVANQAFANYVGGWSDLDAIGIARFLFAQGADLFYSRFVRRAGELAGFGYISRTGDVLRLSGMGIIPAARGSGAAGYLLDHLIDEARERGDRTMVLEVIEQNPRAVALYRRHEFVQVDHLLSWRRAAGLPLPKNTGDGEAEEIPILEALRTPNAREYPQLPWQITRHAVAKLPVARAFRSGGTCVVVGDPGISPTRLHAFFSGSYEMRWEQLRAALAAVLRKFPQQEFVASAIFPAEFGDQLFAPLGFARDTLSQFLMRREISTTR